jgi:hypothetical protein
MATRFQKRETASQFLNDDFQRGLAHWNKERLQPGLADADWQDELKRDQKMLRFQGGFLEELRDEIRAEAAEVPTEAASFVQWFEALKTEGPGQGDALFPWLAEEASRDELRWFFNRKLPEKLALTTLWP